MKEDSVAAKRSSDKSGSTRPKTSVPSKRGSQAVSPDMAINIAMNSLNMLQDKFGDGEFVRAPGDEPVFFVFPKTLDVCLICGVIIPRSAKPYCGQHFPAAETVTEDVQAAPAPVG